VPIIEVISLTRSFYVFVIVVSQFFVIIERNLSHLPNTHMSLVLFRPFQSVHFFIQHAPFTFSWFYPPIEFMQFSRKKTIVFVLIDALRLTSHYKRNVMHPIVFVFQEERYRFLLETNTVGCRTLSLLSCILSTTLL
jgi:hypothetical protein